MRLWDGTRLCGGDAVSAGASRALKVITWSSEFEASRGRSTVGHAAEELTETAFEIWCGTIPR